MSACVGLSVLIMEILFGDTPPDFMPALLGGYPIEYIQTLICWTSEKQTKGQLLMSPQEYYNKAIILLRVGWTHMWLYTCSPRYKQAYDAIEVTTEDDYTTSLDDEVVQ